MAVAKRQATSLEFCEPGEVRVGFLELGVIGSAAPPTRAWISTSQRLGVGTWSLVAGQKG